MFFNSLKSFLSIIAIIAVTVAILSFVAHGVTRPIGGNHVDHGVLVYDVKPLPTASGGGGLVNAVIKAKLSELSKYGVRYGDYSFYVQIYRSYDELLRDYGSESAFAKIEMSYSKLCGIFAKGVRIVVEPLRAVGSYEEYELTLEFVNGVAVCGKGFDEPISVDGKVREVSGLKVIEFRTLNVSRYVLVDPRTLEAYTVSGEPLGTWVFDLGRYVASSSPIALLYSANELAESAFKTSGRVSGLATVLLLVEPRIVGDKVVYKLAPQPVAKVVVYGASESDVKYFVSDCRSCRHVAYRYVAMARELVLEPSAVSYAKLELLPTDAKLLSDFAWYCHAVALHGKNLKVCSYLYGVEWSGRKFVAIPNLGIEEIAYSKRGTLLYVKAFTRDVGLLINALPSVITKAFAITPISHVDAQHIEIVLEGVRVYNALFNP